MIVLKQLISYIFYLGETMKIGILNETDSVEKRVSIVPESIKLLAKNGHEIFFNQIVENLQASLMKNIQMLAQNV